MNPFFTDYSQYLQRFFPGVKVQKISVNTASGCPNRDGTIGYGGCIYCSNASFSPGYCLNAGSVSEQLSEGKKFFSRKYPAMKYLAYFQSFTPTHSSADTLRSHLEEAAGAEDVAGIIVASRPDTLPEDMMDILAEFNSKSVLFVELGIESMHDPTLELINRGHDSETAEKAITDLAQRGINVGVHLIEGLPGESTDMMFETVDRICSLPVDSIKFHHLQVIKGTKLFDMWSRGAVDIHQFTLESYLDHCVQLVKRVPTDIAIERFLASSPPAMVASPKWGVKNFEFTNLLLNRLRKDSEQNSSLKSC